MNICRRLLYKSGLALIRRSDKMRKTPRYSRESPITYAVGSTLVHDLMKHGGRRPTKLYITSLEKKEQMQDEALALAHELGIPVVCADDLFRVWGYRGNYPLIAELQKREDHLEPGSHVVFVNPALKSNVGAIMRSASPSACMT